MTSIRWLGRTFLAPIVNFVAGVAVLAAFLALPLILTFAVAWVGIKIQGYIDPPKHVDPLTVEVCWVQNGANGLERVRGPRWDEPPNRQSIEVPCS